MFIQDLLLKCIPYRTDFSYESTPVLKKNTRYPIFLYRKSRFSVVKMIQVDREHLNLYNNSFKRKIKNKGTEKERNPLK